MPRTSTKPPQFPNDLEMLDNLIGQCYRKLLKSAKKNPKLGDLIKMIELRRKLAPGDADQKRFWQMLEKIRREELQDSESKSAAPRPRTSRKRQQDSSQ